MTVPGNLSSPLLATAAGAAAAAGPIKSLRFNPGDSPYLSRSDSSSNRRTFTIAFWIKKNAFQHEWPTIFSSTVDSSNQFTLRWNIDRLQIYALTGGSFDIQHTPSRLFRDHSAWLHVVVRIDTTDSTETNRVKIYFNGVHHDSGFDFTTSYPSQNTDLGINKSGSTINIGRRNYDSSNHADMYLADFYFIDGSALDPTSFGAFDDNGVWQAAAYSGTFGTNGFHLLDFENESTIGHDSSGNENDFTAYNLRSANASGGAPTVTGTGPGFPAESTAIANLWDGQVSSYPGDFLTAADGGVITISWPTSIQNVTSIQYYSFNGSDRHNVNEGGWSGNSGSGAGYKTAYSGSAIGLTKLQLQKADQASFVKIGAIKVNGTILTTSNYQSDSDTTDIYFDVPTNGTQSDTGAGGEVSGNYCVLNPLASGGTLSNGNLDGSCPVSSTQHATFAIPASGKWYFEAEMTNSGILNFGLAAYRPSGHIYQNPNSVLYSTSGVKNVDAVLDQSYGASWTTGDIIGCACDADAGTITFYKNNSSQGALSHQIAGLFPSFGNGGSSTDYTVNFGQRSFAYSAPTNHKPLCSALLPTATVPDGSEYFDTKLWTGDGNTDRDITGYSFSPDWVWIKSRSLTKAHAWFDTVRGSNKRLQSNTTNAETTHTDQLSAFISNGFTIEDNNTVNDNNATYVGWAWEASSSTVSNTDGSITSSVRANQSAGFSIVSYTGTGSAGTVGHGLNADLGMVITKTRESSNGWIVWHRSFSNLTNNYLQINLTDAIGTLSNYWGSGGVTSSVFGLGTYTGNNTSGEDMIAYCFAPVAGYSSFGSYEGNGSSDGPFIHTGFRPKFVLLKNADVGSTGYDWHINDTERDSYNVSDSYLSANKSDAEATYAVIDFLSNGFKLRNIGASYNGSGNTHVFMAFAENPFQANGGLAR